MTADEKARHSEYECVSGYLKVLDGVACEQIWWKSLSWRESHIIKSLPNFDSRIFYACNGIDVSDSDFREK